MTYVALFCLLCVCFNSSLFYNVFGLLSTYVNKQITFDLFSPVLFVIMKQCWIIYIFKSFVPGDNILTLYFLLTFTRTKLTVVILWVLLASFLTMQIRDFLIFNASKVSVLSPSTWCVTAAKRICRSLDVCNHHTPSLEDAFYFAQSYRVLDPGTSLIINGLLSFSSSSSYSRA
jgi:hypothetical protein